MLSRYEAKRRALDEIAAGQRAADERRKEEAQPQQAAVPLLVALIQQALLARKPVRLDSGRSGL